MWRPGSRRERLVVWSGATVAAVGLLLAYVVLPIADAWSAREARIAIYAEQLARLHGLLSQQDALDSAVQLLRRERERAAERLLAGNTPAVAASSLQRLINRYAEESRVRLDRVDVAGIRTASGDTLLAVPARLTGQGDIYGLVDLLFYLQHGRTLLVIDEFRTNSGRGTPASGNLLTWSIALRGFHTRAGTRRLGAGP